MNLGEESQRRSRRDGTFGVVPLIVFGSLMTVGFIGCGEDAPPPSGEVELGEVGGVVASDDLIEEVLLEWEEVDGAAEYIVYRDGEQIAVIDGGQTSFEDDGAEDAPAPAAPDIISVSDDLSEGVELVWQSPSTPAGPLHHYEVVAVSDDGVEGQPGEAHGKKSAPQIIHYEVCIGGGEKCGSAGTWDKLNEADVGELDDDVWVYVDDERVPLASIDGEKVEASQGEFVDFVELSAAGWSVGEPEPQHYQVRAVSDAGAGDSSAPKEGMRAVGEIDYQWQYKFDEDWVGVEDDCADQPQCQHTKAPSDGSPVDYRVVVDAPGATERVAPDSPIEGYRAVLYLEYQKEPSAMSPLFSGQWFDVQVLVTNQDEVAMEGEEIALSLNQHEFWDGDDQKVQTVDAEGMVRFEDLAIDIVDEGYELAAHRDDETPAEAPTTTPAFDVIIPPSEDHSHITGAGTPVADGTDEATITIVLADDQGEPVAGVTPGFTASGSGNDYGACPPTDADGVSTCTMTSTTAGIKELEISQPFELPGGFVRFYEHWDCNEGAAPFGGGDGTANEPYRICTADHLNEVGTSSTYWTSSRHFVVTDDIDMSDVDYNIIGPDQNNRFQGTFDGNGRVIQNLSVQGSGDDTGMFGYIDSGSELKNIVLQDVEITSGHYFTGGLVGRSRGTITNCHVSGTVQGNLYVGGLVGRSLVAVYESHSAAEVIGGSMHVGGLLGFSTGIVADSYATGDVEGGMEAGGLVGYDGGTIENSYATGAVTPSSASVDGLVGHNAGSTIKNSFWDIDTTGIQGDGGLTTDEFGDWQFFADEGWGSPPWKMGVAPDGHLRPVGWEWE